MADTYVKYINNLRGEIAYALHWAAEDIAATGTDKWYYCGCGGPESSQYTRTWVRCFDQESGDWMVYTVSVAIPRYSPEIVRDILRNAADRTSKYGICEHQCTYIDDSRFPNGGVVAIVFIDKMFVDEDLCMICVTATGPKYPHPDWS